MNLLMAPMEREMKIVKVKTKRSEPEQAQFLSNLGFVEGANISVVCENGGNLIVNLKDSRVAIGKDLALRFTVEEMKNE